MSLKQLGARGSFQLPTKNKLLVQSSKIFQSCKNIFWLSEVELIGTLSYTPVSTFQIKWKQYQCKKPRTFISWNRSSEALLC